VQRTIVHCVLTVVSAYNISFVDLLLFPLDGFWGMYERREFLQRLYVALRDTLGSYRRDTFQKGNAHVVVCLRAPRA
jgi:hypothetical protein